MPVVYLERDIHSKQLVDDWVLFDTHPSPQSYFQTVSVTEDVYQILTDMDNEFGPEQAHIIVNENR